MNNGPVISSKVGRLMACTTPQKCPLLSPRSRYHLPPGQASSFIGMGPLSAPLYGPNCSSRAVNVSSNDARTWISSVMPSVKSSILVAVEIIFPPWNEVRARILWRIAFPFGALLDPAQLVTPESLERFRPLVKRPDRFCVGSIEHAAAVAPHTNQAHFEQHPQVLGYRRLLQPQRIHNLTDGPLLHRQVVQDSPTPRLGHRVECIRSCRRSCHALTIHSYIGICQALFLSLHKTPG